MPVAKESGHYYNQDGSTAYQVPNKSKPGEMRNTTVRDAKKLNLVPSVTTILKVLDKPGLNRWKEQQILQSALTLPQIKNESVDDFAKRVYEDSQEHGKKAREEGTRIHGILEDHFVNAKVTCTGEDLLIIEATERAIVGHFGLCHFSAEKSFANGGYGGKVDLHSKDVVKSVIDFKTSEFDETKKMPGYDEQCMQLAAYRHGLGLPNARCANVFISVNNPGLVVIKEWSEADLERGWLMFQAALNFWQIQKRF